MSVSIPKTMEEAAAVTGGCFIGGGTDLMPLLRLGVRRAPEKVLISRIPEGKVISFEDGQAAIGAGVTLSELAENIRLRECLPALTQSVRVTASPQIRNIATLGGNLMQERRCIYFNQSAAWRQGIPLCFQTGGSVCHQAPGSPVCRAIYYSDPATTLVLYDAQAEILRGGKREILPLTELLAEHGAADRRAGRCFQDRDMGNAGLLSPLPDSPLLCRILVPLPDSEERSGFYKYSLRSSIDFPLINFALRVGGSRPPKIVAGAVHETPLELESAVLLEDPSRPDSEIVNACEEELRRRARLIKEAVIPPKIKRKQFRLVRQLMELRQEPEIKGLDQTP
ncbi:FAD binding domain-containing protein [Cuneatibacter sp. NSJ-177]|uniref:FAD binding domain-containing protein n=1 Tax=Cuneatibacter sp. NSJ-177 TaxID=2931401 RepID=UPI001FD283F9|nr:FAD binding domain-containing protein [Cuneatibacter sp. NSJ-177]MCJ7836500.1 FAD binding domain-containing protein [Cuneatibacter sp. NSJ-177]